VTSYRARRALGLHSTKAEAITKNNNINISRRIKKKIHEQNYTMTETSTSWCKDLLLLSVLICALFSAFLGNRSLSTPDEARYSEIPLEMVQSGDYITPHLDGIKYFEKPILFYWLQVASIKLFGLHEWAMRIVPLLMGLLGCLFTYVAGRKLYGRTCGLIASLLLATTTLYYFLARFVVIDMTLTTLLSACLFSFLLGNEEAQIKRKKYYFWAMFIFSALATLTKGLIGVVFPGAIIFLWLMLFNEWRQLKTYCIPSGILIWLIITLPWHIAVQHANPEFFRFYLIDQQFARYFTSYANREQAFWYLPTFFVLGFFPWIAFLPQTIAFSWPHPFREREKQKTALFLMLWAAVIYLFFQFSHSQLPPYILPIFPPLAILTARYLSAAIAEQQEERGALYGLRALALVGLIVAAAAITAILERWIPSIGLSTATMVLPILFWLIACCAPLAFYLFYKKLHIPCLVLMLSMSGFLISSNLYNPLLEFKSIKPLALLLKPLLQPTDAILSYHGYYQDLPFYLQRRTELVGWGDKEQMYGMRYQDMTGWLIDEGTWEKRWRGSQRMYMIMTHTEYERIERDGKLLLYRMSETPKDVLVTNHPLQMRLIP
jgi:4-amino-4-deoxy-L-arabinose transferase-like glycosyltransferase